MHIYIYICHTRNVMKMFRIGNQPIIFGCGYEVDIVVEGVLNLRFAFKSNTLKRILPFRAQLSISLRT